MLEDGALARVVETARRNSDVLALYMFGSRSTGRATAASDLDLAVLGSRTFTLPELVDLQLQLQGAAGLSIDLVDLRTAEAFLALDVIRGDRVFCRDHFTADTFELFVMRRAGDLEPFERERRRTLATTPVTSEPARS